ncbi:hypothetical protein [Dyella caseinilytica]|uniref:Type IV pilus assembly protein PilV n=1 Tax=Dyella caseinilytica TaxID=1849581 RepID=A0ABX7GR25_9GAMM|nr:hypothetical protein [Dyella caseinilytica]QRN52754.1 hypothetical protein ISN74_15040 [Dyella caseinilytica]GGA08490.1 hypothetical protein GCM10011408_32310 [Dyella caseinilytica]
MKNANVRSNRNGFAVSRRGFVLIDALVAIVIFSIGIVGLVELQASAIQMTNAASYRLNAAMFADQVIAQMWAYDPDQLSSDYVGSHGNGGTKYMTWLSSIDCTSTSHATGCLPGIPANPPSIQVVQQPITNSSNNQYQVTVTVNWRAPGDNSAHSYVSITDIGY